jgi:hypothetical protein
LSSSKKEDMPLSISIFVSSNFSSKTQLKERSCKSRLSQIASPWT